MGQWSQVSRSQIWQISNTFHSSHYDSQTPVCGFLWTLWNPRLHYKIKAIIWFILHFLENTLRWLSINFTVVHLLDHKTAMWKIRIVSESCYFHDLINFSRAVIVIHFFFCLDCKKILFSMKVRNKYYTKIFIKCIMLRKNLVKLYSMLYSNYRYFW